MSTSLGITTALDVQAAVLGGTICVVSDAIRHDGNNTSAFVCAASTGAGWSNNNSGWNTTFCPAVVGWNGFFQAFYSDQNGQIIHVISTDGLHWDWHDNTGIYTSVEGINQQDGGVCAVNVGPVLHLFFRDPGGGGVMHTQWNPGATSWAPTGYIGINASGGMSAAVLGGTVCVVSLDNVQGEGYSNGIMSSTLAPGSGWQPLYTNVNGYYDPGIAAFGGQFVVCYGYGTQDGPQIYQIVSTDGKTWSAPTGTPYITGGGCCLLSSPQNELLLFRGYPGGVGIVEDVLSGPG